MTIKKSCNSCGFTPCNCPPKQEIGCVVPCIDNKICIPLGTFPNTCTDIRTTNLDSVRLVILSPANDGSGTFNTLWHKDSVNDPASFDLTPTFNVCALLDAADTVTWDGNRPFSYELYVVFSGESEEVLHLTGNLCVETLRSQDIAPLGITVSYERTGRNFIFTATITNPHSGYTVGNYNWDFGDGHTQVTALPTVSHLYDADGIFTVCLEVEANATVSESVNPCAAQITGELCFEVEPCVLDLAIYRSTPIQQCDFRFIDKLVFYNTHILGGTVPLPISYDVTFTVNGVVYAQNTILDITSVADFELQTVAALPQVVNIVNYLNNLASPISFDAVDGGDGYLHLVALMPLPSTTWELTVVKSYAPADTYTWNESGYTGTVFVGTNPTVSCSAIP